MDFMEQNIYKSKKGIYGIINNMNGFIYVGQTKQRFNKRYWHHQWKLRDGTHDNIHLQNAWSLYGEENFEFFIIECIDDNDILNDREEYYIKRYREKECCYNIQDGGQNSTGYIRTEKQKKSIGEKNRIHMLGRKHSEETKIKMSEAHKNNRYNEDNYIITDEQALLVKQSLIQGVKSKEISIELNIPYRIINNILSNDTWSRVYVDGWTEFQANRKKTTRFTHEDCLEVYNLYMEGNHTQQEIAEMYGKTRHSIANAIKKIREQ